MTIRLGMIGYGRWGRKIAAEITRTPGFNLRVISTRHREDHDHWGGQRWYLDWRQMLQEETDASRLDGIIAACPPQLNLEVARACAVYHMPLWLEKPMALSVGDAQAIVDVCQRAQLPVLVDHTYLFHPVWPQVRALAKDWGNVFVYCQAPIETRHDFSPYWDWFAHDLAAVIDLFGVPEGVDPALRDCFPPDGQPVRSVYFRNTCTVSLDTRPHPRRMHVTAAIGEDAVTHSLSFTPRDPCVDVDISGKLRQALMDPLPFSSLQRALFTFGQMCRSRACTGQYLRIGLETVKVLQQLWPL